MNIATVRSYVYELLTQVLYTWFKLLRCVTIPNIIHVLTFFADCLSVFFSTPYNVSLLDMSNNSFCFNHWTRLNCLVNVFFSFFILTSEHLLRDFHNFIMFKYQQTTCLQLIWNWQVGCRFVIVEIESLLQADNVMKLFTPREHYADVDWKPVCLYFILLYLNHCE